MQLKRAGFLTKLVVLVLLIYMAIAVLELRSKIQNVEAEGEALRRQVADQRLENQRLEEAIANSDDPEMLEQVARERGYVERHETLFIDIAN